MQIVFDTMLADVPAMVACLAKMRLRDVVAMPECRDEISQLVDVVRASRRLGDHSPTAAAANGGVNIFANGRSAPNISVACWAS